MKNIKMTVQFQFSTMDGTAMWWYDQRNDVYVIPDREAEDIGEASAPYLGANLSEPIDQEEKEKEMEFLVNQEHWSSLLKDHSGKLGCTREMITGMSKQRLRICFKILMASVLEKYEMAVEGHKAHREAVAQHEEARSAGMYD